VLEQLSHQIAAQHEKQNHEVAAHERHERKKNIVAPTDGVAIQHEVRRAMRNHGSNAQGTDGKEMLVQRRLPLGREHEQIVFLVGSRFQKHRRVNLYELESRP
jgi:hypothetical protein